LVLVLVLDGPVLVNTTVMNVRLYILLWSHMYEFFARAHCHQHKNATNRITYNIKIMSLLSGTRLYSKL